MSIRTVVFDFGNVMHLFMELIQEGGTRIVRAESERAQHANPVAQR